MDLLPCAVGTVARAGVMPAVEGYVSGPYGQNPLPRMDRQRNPEGVAVLLTLVRARPKSARRVLIALEKYGKITPCRGSTNDKRYDEVTSRDVFDIHTACVLRICFSSS